MILDSTPTINVGNFVQQSVAILEETKGDSRKVTKLMHIGKGNNYLKKLGEKCLTLEEEERNL